MDEIYAALERCDLFVAIGTSGQVYPASGFVATVRAAGSARTIEVNLQDSAMSSAFAERRQGTAGLLVPALVEELLTEAA